MKWYSHPTNFHRLPITEKIHHQLGHEGLVAFIFIHEVILDLATEGKLELEYSIQKWMQILLLKRKSRPKLDRLLHLMQTENLIQYRFNRDSIVIEGAQILEYTVPYLKSMKRKQPEIAATIENQIERYKQKNPRDITTNETANTAIPQPLSPVQQMFAEAKLRNRERRPATESEAENVFIDFMKDLYPSYSFSIFPEHRSALQKMMKMISHLSSLKTLLDRARSHQEEWLSLYNHPNEFFEWFVEKNGYLSLLSK